MKRNKLANFVADNYVRLLPALVIAVAAGGLGLKFMFSSFAATTDTTIVTAAQDVTTGGAAGDANSPASAIAVRPGDTVQYTITVANKAPAGLFGGKTLSGVKVTDTLPANFQLTTDATAKTIALTFGDIPAGKTISRSFSVKVASTTAATVENIACYETAPQLFQTPEKGCDSAFVRVAPVVVATTPPPVAKTPAPAPSPVSKTPTPTGKTPAPAPTPTPAPAATPATTASADCSAVANGTVKSGSAGVDITVPTSQAKAVQISYGTDATSLDSKSSLTASKGDNTTVVIGSLKTGTTYSYQIIRQCNDDSYKTSDTGTFSTEKLSANIVFTNDDSDPQQGISSSFSCAETGNTTSDSNGMVSYGGIEPGDCKLNYTYQSKQCSDLITVPQPSLSAQVSSADVITLTYKVKACAVQSGDNISSTASKGLAGNKAALIFGILSLILAVLLVMSWLKQHRSNNGGPGAGMAGGDGGNGGFTPPTDMPPTDSSSAVYGAGAGAAAGYAGSIGYDETAAPADASAYGTDAAATADYGVTDQTAPVADTNASYYAAADGQQVATDDTAVAAEVPLEAPADAAVSDEPPALPVADNTAVADASTPVTDVVANDAAPAADTADAPVEAPAADQADTTPAAEAGTNNDDGSLDIPHQPSA